MATKKVSLSLESTSVDDLDYITGRMGISRSALVSQLLIEALPAMRQVIDLIPASPTPADVVRYRGESTAIIQDRLESVRRATDDLFSER